MKDLAMHIMDIVQNSLRAKAQLITLTIDESVEGNRKVAITDDGVGMSKEFLERVIDPYTTSRTTRKVGLGIPLLKQNAERTAGTFAITSKEKEGTEVVATFNTRHIDCLPLGDVAGTLVLLCGANPNIAFEFFYITTKGRYVFKTSEIKETLEETAINEPKVLQFLREMITENMNEI